MKKLLALSILLAIVIDCSASTITVNWDVTGDHTTIQAGINAAVSGADTVIVAEGTYVENISFGGKNIVLTSTDPNDDCAINVEDVRILALAWLSEDGEGAWNPDCDISIPADDLINLLDLGVLEQHWQESTRPE